MDNIENLAQLGGQVVIVFAFLYYLSKQNHEFNTTIQNHLEHSNRVIEKNSDVMTKIATTLEQLCLLIRKNNKGEKGKRGQRGIQGKCG
jgi:predicted PurR-regulated permease PerM